MVLLEPRRLNQGPPAGAVLQLLLRNVLPNPHILLVVKLLLAKAAKEARPIRKRPPLKHSRVECVEGSSWPLQVPWNFSGLGIRGLAC